MASIAPDETEEVEIVQALGEEEIIDGEDLGTRCCGLLPPLQAPMKGCC